MCSLSKVCLGPSPEDHKSWYRNEIRVSVEHIEARGLHININQFLFINTSLAAPGAIAHPLQRLHYRKACKIKHGPQGDPKQPIASEKGSKPNFLCYKLVF